VNFTDLKTKLLTLFDAKKLENRQNDEWGFLNAQDIPIQKIGYATSLTDDIVTEAAAQSVNLLLTHHDAWDFVYGMKEKCTALLTRHNIIHAYFHLPLDDADFGTASALAQALCLQNCEKANSDGTYSHSVIGETAPTPFAQFTDLTANVLQEPVKSFQNNPNPIKKICITTGAGYSTHYIKTALDHHCDTYLTGEYSLYAQQYAKFNNINLLVGSHTNTEILGVQQLAERLTANTNITLTRLPEENY